MPSCELMVAMIFLHMAVALCGCVRCEVENAEKLEQVCASNR